MSHQWQHYTFSCYERFERVSCSIHARTHARLRPQAQNESDNTRPDGGHKNFYNTPQYRSRCMNSSNKKKKHQEALPNHDKRPSVTQGLGWFPVPTYPSLVLTACLFSGQEQPKCESPQPKGLLLNAVAFREFLIPTAENATKMPLDDLRAFADGI